MGAARSTRTSSTSGKNAGVDLYALPPEDFTAARDAAAKDDKSLTVLRRPTVSAWVVNTLVRRDSRLLDELVALGAFLAEAQREGHGDVLRDLGEQRRQLVDQVTQRAVDLVGRDVSPTVRDEVHGRPDTSVAEAVARQAAGALDDAVRLAESATRAVHEHDDALTAARREEDATAARVLQARDALRAAEQEQAAARRRRTGVEREREALVRKATAATKAVATAQTGSDAARQALDRLRRAR